MNVDLIRDSRSWATCTYGMRSSYKAECTVMKSRLMDNDERNPRPMCRLAMVLLYGAQATFGPKVPMNHTPQRPVTSESIMNVMAN
jgi:hypothetical protein